jgi:3-oxoadipate enol-lactonase
VAHASFIPKIKDMIVNTSLNGYVGCSSALSNFSYQDGLASIKAPLLVIVGTKDQMLDGSRAIHRDVPGSKLVELEGAGHLSSVDAADGYNRALDAHISC